jgi:hypothetical protein
VNSWTKRAIGVAALAGGLLALGAGTARADEASTRASVRVGSAPTAEVRLCADGVVLSGLLGRCGGQAGSGSDGTTVRAGATTARVRVSAGPARASLETRPSRRRAAVSGQVRISRPAGLAPSVNADVAADTSPRARVEVEAASPSVRPLGSASAVPPATARVVIMLAREGTADGADATATADLAIPPATADAAVALALFGPANEADVTADAAVALDLFGAADEADATADVAVVLGPLNAASGPDATADATLAVGPLGLGGPASGGADAAVEADLSGVGIPALDGVTPALPALPAPVGEIPGGLPGGIVPPVPGVGGLVPPTSAEVCIGTCDADTGAGPGGTPPPTQPAPTTPAPTPAPTDGGGQDTSTGGIIAPDQTGLTGTGGMLAGAAGTAGTTLARIRSALGDSGGTLPFTGGAADLLAFMALGLLLAGGLLLRAARPARVTERR